MIPTPAVVAIIPAFNEARRVAHAIADARPYVDYVVVIDDCSKDETSQIALQAGAHVLRHPINRGQGAALQTGADYAVQKLHAGYLVHFDADGQMLGSEIPHLLQPLREGRADISLGSRFLGKAENLPPSRKITLMLGLLFTRVISGIRLTDTHNGFRAMTRQTALRLRIRLDRMAHASEILDQIIALRLRYVEVPVTIRYTEDTLAKGQSSLGALTILKDFLVQKFFVN